MTGQESILCLHFVILALQLFWKYTSSKDWVTIKPKAWKLLRHRVTAIALVWRYGDSNEPGRRAWKGLAWGMVSLHLSSLSSFLSSLKASCRIPGIFNSPAGKVCKLTFQVESSTAGVCCSLVRSCSINSGCRKFYMSAWLDQVFGALHMQSKSRLPDICGCAEFEDPPFLNASSETLQNHSRGGLCRSVPYNQRESQSVQTRLLD